MKRYVSLDVMRGFTIAMMILVNNPGSWSAVFHPLRHSAWNGCTLADLVFPFFLFCSGVSMAFSLAKYDTLSWNAVRKISGRGAVLFVLGFLLQAFPFFPLNPDPALSFSENYVSWLSGLRIFGVLQRIALAYVLASFLALILKKTDRIFHTVILMSVLYTAVFYIFGSDPGPFTLEGNVARRIDVALLGENHLYRGFSDAAGNVVPFDPEGLLGTVSASCSILIGYMAGLMIRRSSARYAASKMDKDSPARVALRMFTYAAVSIAVSALAGLWIPVNKPLWTVSYVFATSGWAMLVFAFLIYMVDVKRISAVFFPFKAMGMNPIAIYSIASLVAATLVRVLRLDISSVFGANEYMSFLYSALFVLVHMTIAVILFRKNIFIKI